MQIIGGDTVKLLGGYISPGFDNGPMCFVPGCCYVLSETFTHLDLAVAHINHKSQHNLSNPTQMIFLNEKN